MAAMTYTTLTGDKTATDSIKRWVNNSLIDADSVISEAESWLNENLRSRRMLKRATVSISSTESSYDLSTNVTDFLEALKLYRNGYGALAFVSEDEIDNVRAASSASVLTSAGPKYYTVIDSTILLDTQADQAYTLALTYYAAPTPLSGSVATNLYTTDFRVLFKEVCMAFAYLFMKDEPSYQARLASARAMIEKIREADLLEQPETNPLDSSMNWTALVGGRGRVGSIRSWVNADVPSAEIITLAEDWLAQHLRVRKMVKRTTVSLAENDSSVTLSTSISDFLDPIRVELRGYGPLIYYHEDDIDMLQGADEDGTLNAGIPTYFAIVGGTMMFDCKCDDDYTLIVTHYFRPAALSSSSTTNEYTSNYSSLFKAICMAFAYASPPLNNDEKASNYFMAASQYVEKILQMDDLSRRTQQLPVMVS